MRGKEPQRRAGAKAAGIGKSGQAESALTMHGTIQREDFSVIGSRFQTMQHAPAERASHCGRPGMPMPGRLIGLALLFIGGMAAAMAGERTINSGASMPVHTAASGAMEHAGSGTSLCMHAMKSCSDWLGFLPAALPRSASFHAENGWIMKEKAIGAGFAIGSEFLWEHHYAVFRRLEQHSVRGNAAENAATASDASLGKEAAFRPDGAASGQAAPVLRR